MITADQFVKAIRDRILEVAPYYAADYFDRIVDQVIAVNRFVYLDNLTEARDAAMEICCESCVLQSFSMITRLHRTLGERVKFVARIKKQIEASPAWIDTPPAEIHRTVIDFMMIIDGKGGPAIYDKVEFHTSDEPIKPKDKRKLH